MGFKSDWSRCSGGEAVHLSLPMLFPGSESTQGRKNGYINLSNTSIDPENWTEGEGRVKHFPCSCFHSCLLPACI